MWMVAAAAVAGSTGTDDTSNGATTTTHNNDSNKQNENVDTYIYILSTGSCVFGNRYIHKVVVVAAC